MIRRTELKLAQAWQAKAGTFLAACAVCLLAAAPAAYAQTSISISRVTAEVGTSTTLMLTLENPSEPIAGVHVEFNVPRNISFDGAALGPGLPGFTQDSYTFNEGEVKCAGFIAYSTTRSAVSGQVLATFSFTVGAGATTGPVAIPVTYSELSDVAGTATPAHTAMNGAIMVMAGAGDSLAEIAQMLFDEFAAGDANDDGQLTLDEARSLRDTLTEAQFDAIDTNADGFISMQELIAAGADPGTPEPPSCCAARKATSIQDLRHLLGDFLLLGLAVCGLALMGSNGRRRD